MTIAIAMGEETAMTMTEIEALQTTVGIDEIAETTKTVIETETSVPTTADRCQRR
jgi:hypothetical protein